MLYCPNDPKVSVKFVLSKLSKVSVKCCIVQMTPRYLLNVVNDPEVLSVVL